MAAHKSVLMRLDIRPAGKLCHCKHDRAHMIARGEPRLIVKAPGPGSPELGYCSHCAEAMLEKATNQISELRAQLRDESA